MEKILHMDTGPIYYQDLSTGEPVLLLHGFGEDGSVWNHQVNFLKKEMRLIIPDIPGSGKSEYQPGLITMTDYAERIDGLVQELGLGTFVMIGHSMGGYIALAYAEKFANKLKGLGLVHSSAFADSPEKINTRRKGIQVIEEYGATAFLRQTLINLFTESFRKNEPDQIENYLRAAESFKKESLIQYYEAMILRPDRTSILKSFPKPILMIMGQEDKTVNLPDSLAQSHLPGQSHVHILRNSAHMGMWEERNHCNEILLNFIRQVNEN